MREDRKALREAKTVIFCSNMFQLLSSLAADELTFVLSGIIKTWFDTICGIWSLES